METLNLCIVNLDFIPFRNSGLAIYGEKLSKGLSKMHEITVITSQPLGSMKEEYIDNIRVIRIPLPRFDRTKWVSFGYKVGGLIEDINKKEKFDLIHFLDVHFGYFCNKSFVGTLLQSFNQRLRSDGGIPYHHSFLNLVERYVYYSMAKILEKKALNKATKLVSVSNATKKEFVESYDVNPSKIEVIYNGIDTNFFQPKNSDRLREKLGIKSDQKVLLYVGFTTPRKGVEYLASALKNIDRDFKLIMVGKWEKGYREKFYKQVGKNKNKIIEEGYVNDEDMPYYYSLADIFILPSLLEGFGYPLVEALSCETPVVATRVGAIPEVVGDCGFLIPSRDASALANTINALLADNDLRQKFGKQGRKRVKRYFNEESMISNTEEFYKNILNNL